MVAIAVFAGILALFIRLVRPQEVQVASLVE